MLLKSAYLTLSLISTILLLFIGWFAINKTAINAQQGIKYKTILLCAFTFWHLYLFFISSSGVLEDFGFPPKLPLLVIIPLFAFSGIFIYKHRNSKWVQEIPKWWLVYYQSLRIAIETIFYYSVGAGILPALVTFEGYNYDILFGVSALIMGYFTFTKPSLPLKYLRLWNILGILVIGFIIFLFVTGTYFPQFYSDKSNLLSPIYTQYPYILVAGFLMPSAVFIHLLALIQLKKPAISSNAVIY